MLLQGALRSLRGAAREAQLAQLAQLATRALSSSSSASGEVAVASASPFLRFSNPYPAAIDHSSLLSTIPETQVRARCWSVV